MSPSASTSSEPRIAVSGVRSSWLTALTNWRFISSSDLALGDVAEGDHGTVGPVGPAFGEAVTSTGNSEPSLAS